jgi:hypothetical protein
MSDVMPLHASAAERAPTLRHVGILIFIAVSFSVTMTLHQLGTIEPGSSRYWILVATTSLLPLVNLNESINVLFGQAKSLLFLLVLGGGWQVLTGDLRAAMQLLALILTLAWISTDRALIDAKDFVRLYIALVALGVLVKLTTSLNVYGLVPGFSEPEFGIWRVSFFPNIAYTGILSLTILMVLTRTKDVARAHRVILAIAAYFLLTSSVRAALVSAIIYFGLMYWFGRKQNISSGRLFWTATLVAIGFNVAILFSVGFLYLIQDNAILSALLLRGQSDLSLDQIQYQLYRPWLWSTHLWLFLTSPGLMGWGSTEFAKLVAMLYDDADNLLISAGTESLPTRMMVAYGVVGSFLTVYFFSRLSHAARIGDTWACACFPAVFVLMMNWGTVFHPTDGLFVLLLLMITKGSQGYVLEQSS